jgi:predicted acetyltransferase
MALDIRRLRSDAEFAQYVQVAIYAFNARRDEAQVERYKDAYDPSWVLAAFDGDNLVAGLTIIPFEQHFLGQRIPFGGIATVASMPERRREGSAGALLRQAIVEMRNAGQVLSGLYTPHYSLYRRYGWEISHRMVTYSFEPKRIQTRLPRPAGSYRRVLVEDWEEVARLLETHVERRNGALVRDERRWRTQVFSNDGKGVNDAVIWTNTSGEPRGYAVYRQDHRQTGDPWGQTTLRVIDWQAFDGEAYSALLNYLLGHDLVDEVVMLVAEDEPLLMALEEPEHLRLPAGQWIGMMTRIVDVEGAFRTRPIDVSRVVEGAVTIAVTDASADWNSGVWRIELTSDGFAATRTDTGSDAEMDVTTLAPIMNGFVSLDDCRRAGRVIVHDAGAVNWLDGVLRVGHRPFCPDDF